MTTSTFASLMAAPAQRPVIAVSVLPQLRQLEAQAAAKDAASIQRLAAGAKAELQTAYQLLGEVREWVAKPADQQSNLQLFDLLDRLDKTIAAGAAR